MNSDFSFASLPSFEEIEQKKPVISRCPLTPEKFMVDESRIDKDYTYLKSICASSARSLSEMIEDLCDRLEYEGSFLYDETPDKTTIFKLTDEIDSRMNTGSDTFQIEKKDLILTLLLDEILFRRLRYYRKQKMFQ